MEVRMAVRIGAIEMEFQGSDEVFSKTVEPMARDLIAFGKEKFSTIGSGASANHNSTKEGAVNVPQMTVKAIAGKFGVDSGKDLVIAAVASLAIIKKKETFSRQEINDEMKLAVGYYKPTYSSGNLSGYLETLSKQGMIIESSKDTFALKDSERGALEQKLAH